MCLFILKQICMLEGMHAYMDVSIRKHGGNDRGYKNIPHIEMYFSRACSQFYPHFSPYLFIFPYLSFSHIVAPLWSFAMSPFRMQPKGPCEFRPLALKLNSKDGVIWMLPGGCQLALGRADQVAGWRMPIRARLPSPSLRGHLLCVEKLWGLSAVAS